MDNKRERNGAFAPSQADRRADGVASAKPTIITGSEDATVNRTPPARSHKRTGTLVSTTNNPTDHEAATMKHDPRNLDKTADGRRRPQSQESGRDISDPHPGSVSDGTHSEANETKLARSEGDRKHGTPN